MKIWFLGGADEVGASCALLEIAGRRILIDCGIRMTRTGTERLPDLSILQSMGGPDLICLTHAHLDHTGALPIVGSDYPKVPILATKSTLDLTKVLLVDALKVMDSRWERESEIPLYQEHQILQTLESVVPISYLVETPIFGGEMTLTAHPAGHILGAAMISIKSDEGDYLFTGDIATVHQLTVSGLLPPRGRFDCVVCESTYGNRLHADRRSEERRFVQRIASVIGSGGKVLIPAFALGRAQEVIMILQRAMERREIPSFPVYVDGMVTRICHAYASHASDLMPPLRRRSAQGQNIFFPDGGPIQPVRRTEDRVAIANGEPCCIVASSGMLSGGASAVYAMLLCSGKKNLIAVTGYQDEESPGKALLSLADGNEKTINLPDGTAEVNCLVEKYALSAHADAVGVAGFISGLRPDHVVFVHGDGQARRDLSKRVADGTKAHRHLPKNGEEIEIPSRAKRSSSHSAFIEGGLGGGRPLDAAGLRVLSRRLIDMFPAPKPVTAQDIVRIWTGEMFPSSDKLAQAQEVLGDDEPTGFECDDRRPFLFKPVDSVDRSSPKAPEAGLAGLDMKRVTELFGPDSGLYKKSASQKDRQLHLSFFFPSLARETYAKELAVLHEETGWEIKINDMPHHGALIEMLKTLFPQNWQLAKQPSIHFEQGVVTARVIEMDMTPDQVEALKSEYAAKTGFRLDLEDLVEAEDFRKSMSGDGKMEINAAFRAIDDFFSTRESRPRKKSRKTGPDGSYIELSFLSPSIGEKHQEAFRILQEVTGWGILLADKVDQQGVKELIRTSLPNGWKMSKEPSFFPRQNKIVLSFSRKPKHGAWSVFAKRMEKRTGLAFEQG